MKFNIIPKQFVIENVEAANADEALIDFATGMDTDMNNYMKAVPAGEVDQMLAKNICSLIRATELTASQCSDIFRALKTKSSVLGGKLWTEDDVRSRIVEMASGCTASVDVIDEVVNNIDPDIFDDCADEEWNTIDDAIKEVDVNIYVSGIKWAVDKEDYDMEAEYDAVMSQLPEGCMIAVADLDGQDIADYLSDKYEYLIESYTVEKVFVPMKLPSEYINTDDLQWVKKTGDKSFDLVEVRNDSPDAYIVVAGSVSLDDYSDSDIASCIQGYGYKDQDDVKHQYKEEWAQVIAECLFEQTPDTELASFGSFGTEEDAEKFALGYITIQLGNK